MIKKNYVPFLCMEYDSVKDVGPLRGDSLLLTTRSPGVPGTAHLIDPRRMEGRVDLGATQRI